MNRVDLCNQIDQLNIPLPSEPVDYFKMLKITFEKKRCYIGRYPSSIFDVVKQHVKMLKDTGMKSLEVKNKVRERHGDAKLIQPVIDAKFIPA